MNKDNEKIKKNGNAETSNILNELGLINISTGFDSDIQYINIIGSIEGNMILPPENKTTKYEHLIPRIVSVE